MRPTVPVTFSFIAPSVHSGPTPEPSGVQRFYTVAFDANVMRQVLWFEHGRLECGTWIDGVVPECYRARVREIALEVFERSFRGQLFRPHTMDRVIDELRRAIWRDLEPIEPDPR